MSVPILSFAYLKLILGHCSNTISFDND